MRQTGILLNRKGWFIGLMIFCLQHLPVFCQKEHFLQEGDFLFLDLDCGPLCDAIEAVTEGAAGRDFSHLGLVYKKGDSVFVLEAMGNAVCKTPLNRFLSYTKKPALHARLKKAHQHLIPKAIEFSLAQLGKAYDDAFLPDNGKYYCSELVYDAFREANQGKAFFELQPMTFRQPGSQDFFPVWVDYYRKLGMPVPEGVAGCNPGGISRSPFLVIHGDYSNAESQKP